MIKGRKAKKKWIIKNTESEYVAYLSISWLKGRSSFRAYIYLDNLTFDKWY